MKWLCLAYDGNENKVVVLEYEPGDGPFGDIARLLANVAEAIEADVDDVMLHVVWKHGHDTIGLINDTNTEMQPWAVAEFPLFRVPPG